MLSWITGSNYNNNCIVYDGVKKAKKKKATNERRSSTVGERGRHLERVARDSINQLRSWDSSHRLACVCLPGSFYTPGVPESGLEFVILLSKKIFFLRAACLVSSGSGVVPLLVGSIGSDHIESAEPRFILTTSLHQRSSSWGRIASG